MADVAVQHSVAGAYEPSLFGTYSKKIGMWLFLLSDSLTFGALLFAYSYGRISTPNWPTPFGKASIVNATIMTVCLLSSSLTMVLGVLASKKGDHKATVKWLLATMFFGALFVVLHAKEWSADRRRPAALQQSLGKKCSPIRRHLLHPDRNAHAARHHRRVLPGRGSAAQEVDTHPAGHLAAGMAADAGHQRLPHRRSRAAAGGGDFRRYFVPETESLRRA